MKESDIQRTILDGLTAKRIFAFRLNTGGTKIAGGYFRAHTLGKGAADILAFPRSLLVDVPGKRFRWIDGPPTVWWIEVKTPEGDITREQNTFAGRVTEEGHFYSVVRSWEDVNSWLKERGL